MVQREIEVVKEMLSSVGSAVGQSIQDQRAAVAAMSDALPIPSNTQVDRVSDGIPGNWVGVPESTDVRTILYLHGGAYIAGSPSTHTSLVSMLCSASKSRAFVPDYRLAPEHPFPAAVNDAVAVYRQLLESPELAAKGESAAENIVVMGDSAGGGLSVAMLLKVRELGLPMPAAVVCLCPWADLTCSGIGYETRAKSDPLSAGDGAHEIVKLYLAGAETKNPLASPVFADLTGLPPMLIHAGADDVLVGDALQLEARAHECGVSASLEIWAEMVHVWHLFHPILADAGTAINSIGRYLEPRWKA